MAEFLSLVEIPLQLQIEFGSYDLLAQAFKQSVINLYYLGYNKAT